MLSLVDWRLLLCNKLCTKPCCIEAVFRIQQMPCNFQIFNENAEIWQDGKVDIHLFRLSYPRYYTLDQVNLDQADMNSTVDLRPFINPSPYSVMACTALPRVFNLFRALGLRHLIVINDNNEVVGMVTRKDLVKYRVWKHRGQMGLEELVIYNNVWAVGGQVYKLYSCLVSLWMLGCESICCWEIIEEEIAKNCKHTSSRLVRTTIFSNFAYYYNFFIS